MEFLFPLGTTLFIEVKSAVNGIIVTLEHFFVITIITIDSPICTFVIYVSACHYFRALGVYVCKAVLCIGITYYTACVGDKIRFNSV